MYLYNSLVLFISNLSYLLCLKCLREESFIYILQSQLIKQITWAYKNYLYIIIFLINSDRVRKKICCFIIKSYWKLIVAEQKEKSFVFQLKAINEIYEYNNEKIASKM